MRCPFCDAENTRVIDSRLANDGDQVRRRRECLSCAERFTTYETAELVMPRIVKSDGVREPFNEEKLRSGILRALEKRTRDASAKAAPSFAKRGQLLPRDRVALLLDAGRADAVAAIFDAAES